MFCVNTSGSICLHDMKLSSSEDRSLLPKSAKTGFLAVNVSEDIFLVKPTRAGF